MLNKQRHWRPFLTVPMLRIYFYLVTVTVRVSYLTQNQSSSEIGKFNVFPKVVVFLRLLGFPFIARENSLGGVDNSWLQLLSQKSNVGPRRPTPTSTNFRKKNQNYITLKQNYNQHNLIIGLLIAKFTSCLFIYRLQKKFSIQYFTELLLNILLSFGGRTDKNKPFNKAVEVTWPLGANRLLQDYTALKLLIWQKTTTMAEIFMESLTALRQVWMKMKKRLKMNMQINCIILTLITKFKLLHKVSTLISA